MLMEAVDSGKSCVIDNTNVSVAERKKYIDIAKEHGYKIIGYYFRSAIDECRMRNDQRQGKKKVPNTHNPYPVKHPAFFDSRAFVIPHEDIRSYFIWRQNDAVKNSLSMLAQSLYSHKELHGRKREDLQELCWQKGHNWNDLSAPEKRGTAVYKVPVKKSSPHGEVTRMKFVIDENIPVFSADSCTLFTDILAMNK